MRVAVLGLTAAALIGACDEHGAHPRDAGRDATDDAATGSGGMAAAGASGAAGTAGASGAAGSAGASGTADAASDIRDASGGSGDGGAGGVGGAGGTSGAGGSLIPTRCPTGTGMWSGDFDGDGIVDCASSSGTDLVFQRGVGDGQAASAMVRTVGVLPWAPSSQRYWDAIADLTGEGRQDLTLFGPEPTGTAGGLTSYLMRGQADGTFVRYDYSTSTSTLMLSPIAADFTGDGVLDLFSPTIMPAPPNTNTVAWTVWAQSTIPSWPLSVLSTKAGFIAGRTGGLVAAAVGHVDGDPYMDGLAVVDIRTASQTGPGPVVVIAYGNGDGTFKPTTTDASYVPATMVPGTAGAQSVLPRDVNSDGKLDLVVTFAAGPQTFYGDGAGNFTTTAPAQRR